MRSDAMAYRVVATDCDGTILRSDGTVSDRTRRALATAEDAGAFVVLVTGRPPRWMHEIATMTGHSGVAVCANGAVVYDLHTERILEEFPLAAQAVAEVVRRIRNAVPDVAFAVERGDAGFFREATYHSPFSRGDDEIALEDLVADSAVKLLCRHREIGPDQLLAAARDAVGDVAELTHSSREGLLEISASGVSKATTLARLCGERGYAASDVVAFGDMPNDLPLLGWAAHSVAVANAHPEVLDVAAEVTASNDEDGVARVLERLYAVTGG